MNSSWMLIRHQVAVDWTDVFVQPLFPCAAFVAGDGYDAANSSGSNLAPTNRALVERVQAEVAKLRAENPNAPITADLVTASGSGLDPQISPAAAEFQVPRVAQARHISQQLLRALVAKQTETRQFGIFGEPCVNVLELNLDLDSAFPAKN